MWTFAIVTETRISCLKFEKNRSHFLDFFLVSGCVVFISEFISTFVTFTFHEVSLFFFFVKRYFNTRREIVIWNVFQKEKFPIFSRPCNITRLNITVSKDWIMKLLFVCSQFSLNFHSIIKSHFISDLGAQSPEYALSLKRCQQWPGQSDGFSVLLSFLHRRDDNAKLHCTWKKMYLSLIIILNENGLFKFQFNVDIWSLPFRCIVSHRGLGHRSQKRQA